MSLPFFQVGRRLALCCALIMISATFLSGCGGKSDRTEPNKSATKKIILLNNTESPFWDAARAGIKQASIDLKLADAGFDAHMDDNSGGEVGQIEKLRQYNLRNDVAAVIISPISASNAAIAEELKKLKDKGVIVGCFDSDLSEKFRDIREFYVGTNNIKGGEVMGTAAINLKANGGQYVQFVGKDSQQNAIERMDGFTKATEKAGKGFVQKGRMIDDEDRARARDNVRTVIDQNPELSILVGIWSYNAPAIVDVVTEKKVRDKFTVITFDAEPEAIRYMAQGQIDALVVQNPFRMGYDSVKYVVAKLKHDDATIKSMFPNMGQPGGDILDTGLKLVTPEKNSPLKKEQFEKVDPNLEILTLPQFQDWLNKYNLKSS